MADKTLFFMSLPKPEKLVETSAGELAGMISAGELTSREIVEAHIRRIEAVNPTINAVVVPLFEKALEQAAAADAALARGERLGPLHGVPVTVKESYDLVGTPTTLGLPSLAIHRPERNAPLVQRLIDAGAIILGKTNLPQMAMANECDNPLYGRTNNPHDVERAPGGSSGGEGAIIGAFGSPLGLGSDIGGSVRLPANACGISSLKPTSTRLTMLGHAEVFPGMEAIICQPGPLARSVADLELVMEIFSKPGPDQTDPTIPPVPWKSSKDIEIKNLRVAVFEDNGFFRPNPGIRRAVREAADTLRAAGVTVETWTPPDVAEAFGLFVGILYAEGWDSPKRIVGNNPRWPVLNQFFQLGLVPNWLLPFFGPLLDAFGQKTAARTTRVARRLSAAGYWAITDRRTRYRDRFMAALDAGRYDAILCPVDGLPALRHGASFYLTEAVSYTTLFNLLGLPAGVVPMTKIRAGEETERPKTSDLADKEAIRVETGSAGMPVGVQVAGRYWREDVVLALMKALENNR